MIWHMFHNDVIVEIYVRFKCYWWKQKYIQVQKHGKSRKNEMNKEINLVVYEGEIHPRDINQKCFHEFYMFSES